MDSASTHHGRMAVDDHSRGDDDVLVETAGDTGLAEKVVWRIKSSQGALVRVVRYLLAEQRREARRYSAMSTLSTMSTVSTESTMSTLSSGSSGSNDTTSASGSTSKPRSLGINLAVPRPTLGPHSGPSLDEPSPSAALSPPMDRQPKPVRVGFATLNQLLSASLNKRKRPETHYDGIPISVILSNPHFPAGNSATSSSSSSTSTSSPTGRQGHRGETRQIASPRRVGLARMLDNLAVGEGEDGYGGEGDHRMTESDGDQTSEEEGDDEDDLVIIV